MFTTIKYDSLFSLPSRARLYTNFNKNNASVIKLSATKVAVLVIKDWLNMVKTPRNGLFIDPGIPMSELAHAIIKWILYTCIMQLV